MVYRPKCLSLASDFPKGIKPSPLATETLEKCGLDNHRYFMVYGLRHKLEMSNPAKAIELLTRQMSSLLYDRFYAEFTSTEAS